MRTSTLLLGLGVAAAVVAYELLKPKPKVIGFYAVCDAAGDRWAINSSLLKAIIQVESGWNEQAYNSGGFDDPNQGCFGLGQIAHTNAFSWPRVFGLSGNWPADLYQPGLNIELTARVLRYFFNRRYGLETIDIYNLGETRWAAGERNEPYRSKVLGWYSKFTEEIV